MNGQRTPARLADRCPGSLQLVMNASGPATACPVCDRPVSTVPINGQYVLVEHRRRSVEALPMALFA